MSNKRPVKIFRVPRSDTVGGCTILHIHPQAATIELNVKITATDGEVGYTLDLKENKVGRLQDEIAHQSEDDWKSVLRAALLADPREEDLTWKLKLEMTSLLKGNAIVIELRQDINGIKQRLGFLEIPSNDEVEVELWQWLDETCKEKDESQFKLRVAEDQLKKQLDMVGQLTSQLQDLIAAKKEHEDALIVRFQLLLNEKKQKLRDQTTGGISGTSAYEASPSASQAESPEEERPSKRKGKRKATNDMVEDNLEDMDIGSSEADERLLQSGGEDSTPDATEDEEAIEDSYAPLDKKKPNPQTRSRAPIKRVIGKIVKPSTTLPKQSRDDVEMDAHDGDESDEEL